MRKWSRRAAGLNRSRTFAAAAFTVFAAIGGFLAALGAPTVTVGVAAVGVVGAFVALVLAVLSDRAMRREELEALWRRPPMRLREVAIRGVVYELGVETEAPEALEALAGEHQRAPYVRRD